MKLECSYSGPYVLVSDSLGRRTVFGNTPDQFTNDLIKILSRYFLEIGRPVEPNEILEYNWRYGSTSSGHIGKEAQNPIQHFCLYAERTYPWLKISTTSNFGKKDDPPISNLISDRLNYRLHYQYHYYGDFNVRVSVRALRTFVPETLYEKRKRSK